MADEYSWDGPLVYQDELNDSLQHVLGYLSPVELYTFARVSKKLYGDVEMYCRDNFAALQRRIDRLFASELMLKHEDVKERTFRRGRNSDGVTRGM